MSMFKGERPHLNADISLQKFVFWYCARTNWEITAWLWLAILEFHISSFFIVFVIIVVVVVVEEVNRTGWDTS
jgi:hypothetical protein